MIVRADDIRRKILNLKLNLESREEIARYAWNLMNANDNRELVYEPANFERVIWNAIIYLGGYDLKVSPSQYLHSIEDLELFEKTSGLQ